jgi:ATP-dependent DNA ligase
VVRLEKPNYRLKDRAWLETEVRANPGRYNVTRKYDGALVNGAGREGRLYLHSHREGGETYYDRFPQIEYLANDSRLLSCRLLFPRADFEFLIQGEIVHLDGAARAGGLCNSHPEKAVAYQQEHGEADLYVWDCLSYHGKDISPLPYRERHVYAARLVEELRPYSDHIHRAEEMPASGRTGSRDSWRRWQICHQRRRHRSARSCHRDYFQSGLLQGERSDPAVHLRSSGRAGGRHRPH